MCIRVFHDALPMVPRGVKIDCRSKFLEEFNNLNIIFMNLYCSIFEVRVIQL